MLAAFILTLATLCGQLAKVPFSHYGGITFLDLAVIGFAGYFILQKKLKLGKPPFFIASLLLFVLWGNISLLLTPLQLQPVQYLTSIFYSVRLVSFILLGWAIFKGSILKKDIWAEKMLFFSGLGLALLGLVQLIFFPSLASLAVYGWDPHVDRVVSTFLDPNFLSAFLGLSLVLIYLSPHPIVKNRLKIAAFVIIYAAFLGTSSRGGYVMLSVSFGILSLLLRNGKTVLLTLILVAGMTAAYFVYKVQVAQPLHVNKTQSAELRISSWEQGSQMFLESPLLGVGFNAYRYGLAQYHLASSAQIQSRGATSNDSSLLFVGATSGAVGLIIYLSFWFSILKIGLYLYKIKNKYGIMLLSMTGGILAQSFFIDLLFYPFIMIWIFTLSAVAARQKKTLS